MYLLSKHSILETIEFKMVAVSPKRSICYLYHRYVYTFLLSNTFSSVQANANQIWKFQRYYLVMEYAQRPVLIPPFIILNHVIHAIKGLYRWLKNCRGRGHRKQENSSFGLSKYDFRLVKLKTYFLILVFC